ncbi:DUF805 domain-containing protein [Gemmobacter serpentinus]|uniref:DUF805 domain-containing protein n=1 Tax=Gemmobacter serpentinus TaxID=2652247 RepID=UPI00124F3EE4|nr:DUF805 domain-containing protein [Gemmobacter serpentinus]
MGFTEAVETCLKRKYATFSGRAARSEYWWFILFNYIVMLVIGGIAALIVTATLDSTTGAPSVIGYLFMGIAAIVILALFIPSIAVAVRRLHDRNLSGWWYLGLVLVSLIPIIGSIVSLVGSIAMLVIFCLRGTPGDNKYGPDPLNPAGRADIFA